MNKLKKNPEKAFAVFILVLIILVMIFFDKINNWFRGLGADLGTIVFAAIIISLLAFVFKMFFFPKKK